MRRLGLCVGLCLLAGNLTGEPGYSLFPAGFALFRPGAEVAAPSFSFSIRRLERQLDSGDDDPPPPEGFALEPERTPWINLLGEPPEIAPRFWDRLARPSLFQKAAAAAFGAVALNTTIGYFNWWKGNGAPFHTVTEGWFGRGTYAGGADKTSHFYFCYALTDAMTSIYEHVGQSTGSARILAASTVAMTGVIEEVGDGLSVFGFSFEDVAADVLGAGTSVAIAATDTQDLFGFRHSYVTSQTPANAAVRDLLPGFGHDYSTEIQTFDVKLGGLFRRLSWPTGVSRYFLVSASYGTKGYGFLPVEARQRNLGIQFGLNMPEVLRGAGVSDDSWWGRPLLLLLTYFQLPYTAIGYAYDWNHHRWHGPDPWHRYRN